MSGCERKGTSPAGTGGEPWQPHGLRRPQVSCTGLDGHGLVVSASPMPDHIAELRQATGHAHVIVAERTETELAQAMEHARGYYRGGLLTAPGARVVTDARRDRGETAGHVLRLQVGSGPGAQIEQVYVLAFAGLPLIELLARFAADDTHAEAAIEAVAQSITCRR